MTLVYYLQIVYRYMNVTIARSLQRAINDAVISQTYWPARSNPVESLRSE